VPSTFSEFRQCRVLIVEDDPLIGMLMTDFLEELGCSYLGPCPTLPDALGAAESGVFDVGILDLRLGADTVYPVAHILIKRGIPFAFATGFGGHGIEAEWKDRPHIDKPYVLGDVERVLGLLMRR
jgi:CheY-like chemotaxis protein